MCKKTKESKENIYFYKTIEILNEQNKSEYKDFAEIKHANKILLTDLFNNNKEKFLNDKEEMQFEIKAYSYRNKNKTAICIAFTALIFTWIFNMIKFWEDANLVSTNKITIILYLIGIPLFIGTTLILSKLTDIDIFEKKKVNSMVYLQFKLDIMNEIIEEQGQIHKVKPKKVNK